jgi:hypothetical protein
MPPFSTYWKQAEALAGACDSCRNGVNNTSAGINNII